MPFLVRSRNNGKTFELRVKHRRPPKPVYHTFDVQEDAQRAGRARKHPVRCICPAGRVSPGERTVAVDVARYTWGGCRGRALDGCSGPARVARLSVVSAQ
jgi:hypothetical protein